MRTHTLLAPTLMCPQRVQHRLLFFFYLNYFLTQSLLVAAAWCPKALKPCSPPPATPLPALEILFIICGKVYCLEILDFISPLALTDTWGKGGGVDVSIWFCFMICCGGSVKFSGAVGLEDHVNERPGDGL